MRVMAHFALWCVNLARAETQTSDAERACLARHAAGRLRLVEIGVWHGVTTCVIRGAMRAEATLFAVDPFPRGRLGFSPQRAIARREVGKIRNGEVRWIRATGAEAGADHAKRGEAPVDFIFIDGDHTYDGLRGDWEAWRENVAPLGLVAFHDSRSSATQDMTNAGSAIYVREVVLKDARFEPIDAVDTLTVVRRRER